MVVDFSSTPFNIYVLLLVVVRDNRFFCVQAAKDHIPLIKNFEHRRRRRSLTPSTPSDCPLERTIQGTMAVEERDKDINLLSARGGRGGGSVRNAIKHNSRGLSGQNRFIISSSCLTIRTMERIANCCTCEWQRNSSVLWVYEE